MTDAFLPKIEEWIEGFKGRIRADKAHEKLLALGYTGSERSTRRAIAQVKAAWRLGHTRVHRPWITEPGMWLQYDFGDGPRIGGVKTILFVAWLAFSRFRIVIPLKDRTAPSVFVALDRCFRILGGAPTYVLTDNEKTVTTAHVAGVPIRNQQTLDFARHYGVTVLTCQPADPATKGGVEASVKLTKADIVPKDTNLRDEYGTFAELEAACAAFMEEEKNREHRVTRRRPAAMLAEEAPKLHRIPDTAHTVAFGLGPHRPGEHPDGHVRERPILSAGATAWGPGVRAHPRDRPRRAGHHRPCRCLRPGRSRRHDRARPGSPAINDEHFPGIQTRIPGDYEVRARSADEAAFLAIGDGARTWPVEAAAAGTARMNVKMAAVTLAKTAGTDQVDRARGDAALHGRFAHPDLASILSANIRRTTTHAANEATSLTQGTGAWAAIGNPALDTTAKNIEPEDAR